MAATQQGTVHRINVSDGGVPKLPVENALVSADGLEGDRQQSQGHGGTDRAVLLLGLDLIDALKAQGHAIEPGSTGENLTLTGLDWRSVPLGSRFVFENGVELEALSYAPPCATIAASFRDGDFRQLDVQVYPGQGRICTRVLREGAIRNGETVRVEEGDLKTA